MFLGFCWLAPLLLVEAMPKKAFIN